MIYNFENQTYRVSGMSVINDPEHTKQEGLKIYLRSKVGDKPLEVYLDKRDCARISKATKKGRRWWKRFRMPKMRRQMAGEN